jgi:hypothetical protein
MGASCIAGAAVSARVMEIGRDMTYEGALREREFFKGA